MTEYVPVVNSGIDEKEFLALHYIASAYRIIGGIPDDQWIEQGIRSVKQRPIPCGIVSAANCELEGAAFVVPQTAASAGTSAIHPEMTRTIRTPSRSEQNIIGDGVAAAIFHRDRNISNEFFARHDCCLKILQCELCPLYSFGIVQLPMHLDPLVISYAGVDDYRREGQSLNREAPPSDPLFAFLSSFVLFWCKGLYNNPRGLGGFLLATVAVLIGVIFADGLLDWRLEF